MQGTPQPLRILFFSDWRLPPVETLDNLIAAASPLDLILYGGDDVARFGAPPAPEADVLQLLRSLAAALDAGSLTLAEALAAAEPVLGEPIALLPTVPPARFFPWTADDLRCYFALPLFENAFSRLATRARFGLAGVIGNDCRGAHRLCLRAARCRDLHAAPFTAQGWGFIGIEGAVSLPGVPGIGYTIWEDTDLADHLARARAALGVPDERLVIVSHVPPAGILDVGIRFEVENLGSPALAAFVAASHPAAVLCGHVHSHGGQHTRVGPTLVVNAACDDTRDRIGRAALIDLGPIPFR